VAVFVLTGCATQQVDFQDGIEKKRKPDHKLTQNFFVFGLVPNAQTVKAEQFCKDSEIQRVETEMTFLNGLLTGVTYNIYTPRTLKVYCEGGGQMSSM
jgi:hypothetical protein